ncbi:hypothetical protein SAMN05660976_00230 [Nonomuraea pusilla]|uniref:Uncharacterized protein n=2 Tax=Nonomuraea pusilla TaxID=46177 RepID=A0A1H7FYA9_9ACTN|nr:hypothetical protein SAMN05660976_00230 [Nonomuraea pusilla]
MSPPPTCIGIDPTLMTQLINEIKRLQQSWAEVDARINSALQAVGTSMSGPGLLKDIGAQIAERVPDLQRRLDLIIATQKISLDKGVIWADESLWVSYTPAGGAAAAKTVADELRQARQNFPFLQRPLSDKTLDELEKHRNDPYFAVAFAKEMPPKELKALLTDLDRAQDSNQDHDATTDVGRLMKAVGSILGTASRGVGDMKLPKDYVDQLIANEDARHSRIVNDLLRHGTFDDAFLLDLARKVYDNAQQDRANQTDIITFRSGLAAALANNPRVAQDFFADPARKPLAFLMRQNNWAGGSRDLGRAIEAATMTYRDNTQPPETSRGYKSALIASWAVHFWSDPKAQWVLPDTRQSAARVLAAYISDVQRVPGNTGKETMGVTPLADPDPNLAGKQPYGALFEAATMKNMMTWAFTDPEALKTVVEAQGRYSLMVLDAQAAEIKAANDQALRKWIHENPGATKTEISAQRQKILEDSMTSGGAEEFKAKVLALSQSLHLVVDAGNLADIKEADRKDKAREAFKDALASTLKLVLTPAGDATVAGYEWIESNMGDRIKFEDGKKAREIAESTLIESQNLFKDLTAGAMMRHGLFGDESSPGSTHPHAFENYAKGSPGDFLSATGQLIPRSAMNATQEYAYLEWLQHSKASRIFHDTDNAVQSGFRPPAHSYPEADE